MTVLIIPLIGLIIALVIWTRRRSRVLLEQWAADNGFTILSREHRYLRRGPYLWTTGKGQDVYYIEVQDTGGTTRSGFVRCGGYWSGMLSDKVTVAWDQ